MQNQISEDVRLARRLLEGTGYEAVRLRETEDIQDEDEDEMQTQYIYDSFKKGEIDYDVAVSWLKNYCGMSFRVAEELAYEWEQEIKKSKGKL